MRYARGIDIIHELGTIDFELTNNDNEIYRFLSYQTPFEDFIAADMFDIISGGGDKMVYMGPVARRVTPAPLSAHISVHPSNSLSVRINLSQYYAIRESGFYVISSKVEAFSDLEIEPFTVYLASNIHTFFGNNFANQYTNCAAGEITQVASSTTAATTQARNARSCMDNFNACATLADTWFGAYNSANYNYDLQCFINIVSSLSDGINAYCNPAGCDNNVYAYVYPNDPQQTVYLCGAFWSQPNEQANTIVHEQSHFSVVCGTQDYTYGRASCMTLANNNPYQASRNADNVCYFSEDA